MILIDERGNKIQATVKKDLIPIFYELIKEDSQVLIKKFGVGVFNDPYPVVQNTLKMNFYRCTEVVPEVSFNGHPYGFAFVPFNEITKQKSKSVLNVDVIGSVTWCGNVDIFKSSTGKESKRFNLEMKDLDLILKEGNESNSQSTLSTQTVYPNRLECLLNTERKKVDEIRETKQAMECVVLGTIMLLEQEFGWFYVACRKCNKKEIPKSEYLEQAKEEDITEELLNADPDSLWYTKEKSQATQLIPRYRVTFRVQDSTGSVSFLMFDRDVAKLVGVSANDIRERQLKTNFTETFPHELDLMLNKLLAFKIVISKFNLDRKYGIYTVQKFCDDPAVIADMVAADTVNEVTEEPQIGEISTAKLSEYIVTGWIRFQVFLSSIQRMHSLLLANLWWQILKRTRRSVFYKKEQMKLQVLNQATKYTQDGYSIQRLEAILLCIRTLSFEYACVPKLAYISVLYF